MKYGLACSFCEESEEELVTWGTSWGVGIGEGCGMNAVAEMVGVFEFAEVAEKNKDVTKAV